MSVDITFSCLVDTLPIYNLCFNIFYSMSLLSLEASHQITVYFQNIVLTISIWLKFRLFEKISSSLSRFLSLK